MSGIDLNAPGLEVDAHLELTLGMGRTLERIGRHLDRLEGPPPQVPVFYRLPQSDVVGADGTVTLRLQGPDQGHVWYVRSVTVGGLTPGTATAGAADVFVLSSNPGNAVPSLLDWRDQASRLPSIAFYGDGELEVRANEQVWVRFSGCTPAQVVAAVVQVQDIQEGATQQTWGL